MKKMTTMDWVSHSWYSLLDIVSRVPVELGIYILSYLPKIQDVLSSSLVSHAWHALANDPLLWRCFFERNPGWNVRESMVSELPFRSSLALGGKKPVLDWKVLYMGRTELDRRWMQLRTKPRNDAVAIPFQPTISRLRGHEDSVYCAIFLPAYLNEDRSCVATGSRDRTIRIWNGSTNRCEAILRGHTGSVLCLKYSHGQLISGSSDGTARVWNCGQGTAPPSDYTTALELRGHTGGILALAADANWIVTASRDTTLSVWNRKDGSRKLVFRKHRASVNACDIHEGVVASGAGDGSVWLWDIQSGKPIRSMPGPHCGLATLHLSRHVCVTGSSDRAVRIWDTHSGTCLSTFRAHEQLVRSLCYDSARQLLVTGGWDRKTRLWNLAPIFQPSSEEPLSPALLLELGMHHARVFHVELDATRILSSCEDTSTWVTDFGGQGLPAVFA